MEVRGSALVTGASRGIGKGVALELAKRGFDVLAGMRNPADGADLHGVERVRLVRLDVTDPSTIEVPDDLTVVVNNAGADVDHSPVEHSDADGWRLMLETNVIGVLNVTKAALPVLRANAPSVVATVTSSSILMPVPFYAGYRASKAAASAVCDSLRMEVEGLGVRVLEVLPGPIDTDMWRAEVSSTSPAAQHAVYRAMAERAIAARDAGAVPMLSTIEKAAVLIADAILADSGPMRVGCDPMGAALIETWRTTPDEHLYAGMAAGLRG
ncbi:MAG TPA: SDR family NAD(P)-dependent oxidoreductase [Mycobacteriales bacterium]|nr:SDR family NAD(P)-dependent oxidoreductase [Mycobacteriales bacterium]